MPLTSGSVPSVVYTMVDDGVSVSSVSEIGEAKTPESSSEKVTGVTPVCVNVRVSILVFALATVDVTIVSSKASVVPL